MPTLTCTTCAIHFNRKQGEINRKKTNFFCSRSCAAIYNNKHHPKRKPEHQCKRCQKSITSSCRYCVDCNLQRKNELLLIKSKKTESVKEKLKLKKKGIKSKSISSIKKKYLSDPTIKYQCFECGIIEWQNTKLILDLDHINGNSQDNTKENLRLLCPNCHSQTPTFRNRNYKKKNYKSDLEFIDALKTTSSIHQALLKLGLAAKGLNYSRAKKLLKQIAEVGLEPTRS